MKTHRREFLLSSTAAAALRAAPPEQEIKTAMIGIGHRGTSLVKQVLAQPNVKITAICDIDAQTRDAAQSLAKRDNPRSLND